MRRAQLFTRVLAGVCATLLLALAPAATDPIADRLGEAGVGSALDAPATALVEDALLAASIPAAAPGAHPPGSAAEPDVAVAAPGRDLSTITAPEPDTAILFGIGLLLLAQQARRAGRNRRRA